MFYLEPFCAVPEPHSFSPYPSLSLSISPSLQTSPKLCSFTVSTILTFPEFHTGANIYCGAFADWLLSLRNMYRFLYVPLWVDKSLYLEQTHFPLVCFITMTVN